jgi:hypothetical protein
VAAEKPSQRARDLADLILIEELAIDEDDLVDIRTACVEIFDLGRDPNVT